MDAYAKEKENWLVTDSITVMHRADVPRNAVVLSSHVVYRYKPNGALKARIVPHGNMDPMKDVLRSDAPCMRPDMFRLVCSVAVENGWAICEMDIKSAFLQADGFKRDIYIRPPSEENDRVNIWHLKRAAYGLAESGRLWWLTSDEAFKQFGATQSNVDLALYFIMEKEMLVFMAVAQVDNYIYTGTKEMLEKFERHMESRFAVGECVRKKFRVYGCEVIQYQDKIVISQKKRLAALSGYSLHPVRASMGMDEAIESEQTGYRSIVGSLSFIGCMTSPIIARIACQLATRSRCLQVRDLKALNSAVKYCKSLSGEIVLR